MKKIGLIFAMKEELEESLKYRNQIKEHKIYDLTIYETDNNKDKIYLLESGIGKVNAARATQILIDKFEIDEIINVGVAGALTKDIKIGDIVIGTELVQHDFDLTAFKRKKGEIPNTGIYIKTDNSMLQKTKEIERSNVHTGVIASGDIFIDNKVMSQKIHDKFKALCVEMEGAAIAQVCFLSNIPFLVLRAISDSPREDNNKVTYEEFLETSSKEIALFLNQYLEKK